ncbi:hypothetical protein BXA48_16395, partial [Enterococcus faecium]
RVPITAAKTSHRKNQGYWLTPFQLFISMAMKADSKWIYHNASLRAPLRRAQGVSGGYGIKQATTPPENCRKRAR